MSTSLGSLCLGMFERGLGELLMLHVAGERVLLGNLVKDKGTVVLKDRGILKSVASASVAPCWDIGIIGAVCDLRDNDWQSLSFLGADRCKIPVDLSETRRRLLSRMITPSGESIITFKGTVYRGFKAMLDSHLLPLVLPFVLETNENVTGLAVCDFRFASTPLAVAVKVNDLVRASVDRHLTFSVEDFEMGNSEFQRLFGNYLKPGE